MTNPVYNPVTGKIEFPRNGAIPRVPLDPFKYGNPPPPPPPPTPPPLGGALNALGKLGGGILAGIASDLIFAEPTGDPPFSRRIYKSPQETPESKGNPPFTGGQSLTKYRVTYRIKATRSDGAIISAQNNPDGFFYATTNPPLDGQIVGIGFQRINENPNSVRVVIISDSGRDFDTVFIASWNASAPVTTQAEILSVERADGLPDTGGDPAPVGGTPFGREIGGAFPPPYYDENGSGVPRAVGGLGDSDGSPRGFMPTPPTPNSNSTGSSSTSSGTSSSGSSSSSSSGSSSTSSLGTSFSSPRNFISVPPPAPPTIPQAPPTPERTREKDPDKVPVPPPYKEIKSPPPPPVNPNADLEKAITDLKQQSNENKQLLLGIPALIPPALVGNQAFQDSVKNSSKAGTCEASAPNGCVDNAVKRNTDNVTDNVNAKDAENKAIWANILTQIGGIVANIGIVLAKIKTFAESTVFTSAINTLTFITTVHNAAMLSRDLGITLIDTVGNALSVFGLKLKNADTGEDISLSTAIGQGTEALLKNMLGVATYTELTTKWATANRIYQAGMNVLSTTQSLLDSARSLNEATGNNVGRIGNALKLNGLVRENEYPMMSENNSQASTIMSRLEATSNAVGVVSSITGEVLNVQQQVAELQTNRAAFDAALADKPPKEPIENIPKKESEATKKTESLWEIADFAIVKANEEEVES